MKEVDNAIQTALKTMLALYTEEHALVADREIDNNYLIQNLSALLYSNRVVTSYNTKKLLSGIRENRDKVRDFSNPDRILDVMNFLAVKDDLIVIIKKYLDGKKTEEAKHFLLKLTQDFSNFQHTKQGIEISKNFSITDIFNMLIGYILIKEFRKPLTVDDFVMMEMAKDNVLSLQLLLNLDSMYGYFKSLDHIDMPDRKIVYRNFDKSVKVNKLSIRNRNKVRKSKVN